MKQEETVILYNGITYTIERTPGKLRVFISEDERSCIVTDLENNIQAEITAKTICNSGFLKVD